MYTRCERIQYRGPGRVYTSGHSVHSSENRCVNTRAAVPQFPPSPLPLPIVPERRRNDGTILRDVLRRSLSILSSHLVVGCAATRRTLSDRAPIVPFLARSWSRCESERLNLADSIRPRLIGIERNLTDHRESSIGALKAFV